MAPDVLSRFLWSSEFFRSLSMYLARHAIEETLIFHRIDLHFLPCFDRFLSCNLRHYFLTQPIVFWSLFWSSFGCLWPSHHILSSWCVISIVYQVRDLSFEWFRCLLFSSDYFALDQLNERRRNEVHEKLEHSERICWRVLQFSRDDIVIFLFWFFYWSILIRTNL